MIAFRALLAPLAGAAFLLCATRAYPADTTLLIHGHIYAADPAHPWVQALALRGARIDVIGSDREVLAHRQPHAHVIDLKGRTVGTLAPGKDAELVVLSQDVFAVDAFEIARTHALLTMVGGKVVFEAPAGLQARSP